jgi:hypothetical protein
MSPVTAKWESQLDKIVDYVVEKGKQLQVNTLDQAYNFPMILGKSWDDEHFLNS